MPKITWCSLEHHSDKLYDCIPDLSHLQVSMKREVSSAVGKFFDVLGWFSPSIVQIKILLQLSGKSLDGMSLYLHAC